MTRRVLVVRLDSMGDVLICGPAIRAVAGSAEVGLLVGPAGAAVAPLLPGVSEMLAWDCPWISATPPPVEQAGFADLVEQLRRRRFDEAVILTSFHQSALPTALLLRLAGIARISAASTDYPGSLLDLRVPEPPELPEPVRMVRIVEAAGFSLPPDDDGRLRIQLEAGVSQPAGLPQNYLVVHPGAAAPARTCSPPAWRLIVQALRDAGFRVAVTGSQAESELTAELLVDGECIDLAGQLSLPQLSLVLARAHAVVVGNTGPAHLAAAVGTPIVSLFAPVVSPANWAPYTERLALLGRVDSECARTRARVCPVPGHPCLDSITGTEVLAALSRLGVQPPEAVG